VDGFYDGLSAFIDHLVATGFVRPAHAALMTREADPDALIGRLRQAVPAAA
jgi:predicted Rossmann-fold nucleotide-binding protein